MAAQRNKLTALRETYAAKRAAVFRIQVEPENGERGWVGSGFFISASGYALTAFHNLPRQVKVDREGDIRGWNFLGKPLLLKFIPVAGDRSRDIALLQANGSESQAYVSIAALPSDLSDAERMHFWALRDVVVFGFPVQGGQQIEKGVSGRVPGDFPLRTVVEEDDGVPTPIERLHIGPGKIEELAGISGGPVVEPETGLVVAVAGARQRHENVLLASEVTPWPPGTRAIELPFVHVIRVGSRSGSKWMAVALGLVITLAAVGLFLSGFFDRGPGSNGSVPQATTTTSKPTVPPVVESATSVPDAPSPDVRAPAPAPQPPPPAPPQSACDVTVTTGLPYDEFGGSHTCGFEIAGTVTPAPTPRDVILFVTAGRDVPETRYLGRFAVGAGASGWRIPDGCKGARYSVAVAVSGALPALDRSRPVPVPRPGQEGVSCVETFEGQR